VSQSAKHLLLLHYVKLILVVCCVSDMQKKSDDEDICACVEVSNVPALKHISSEVELNWDSVQVCCF